jgi:flagellar basal-body rod modification protein FlgD
VGRTAATSSEANIYRRFQGALNVNFTPISGVNSAADAAESQNTSTAKSKSELMGKDAFMQLLVAQIRNQNPLNPADGVEFLTQLAQFSQLEQSMGIREEITGLRTQVDTINGALAKIAEANGSDDTQGEKNV